MVRVVESQQVGYFSDGEALHQQILGFSDHKLVDVADGRAAGLPVHQIAEIAGRVGQLRSAPSHGGKALFMLQPLCEIIHQQTVETLEDIAVSLLFLRNLAEVDTVAITQNQLEIACDDGSEGRGVGVFPQFRPERGHEQGNPLPFLRFHPESLCGKIGEERVGGAEQFSGP